MEVDVADEEMKEAGAETEMSFDAGQVSREDSTGVDGGSKVEPNPSLPTRDPSVQVKSRRLRVGDTYVVNYPRKAPVATATIKVLTNEPGRHVGVEFHDQIGPYADNGNCHGKCRPGCGLWVHPTHLLTEEEHRELVLRGESDPARVVVEVEELDFDADTGLANPS